MRLLGLGSKLRGPRDPSGGERLLRISRGPRTAFILAQPRPPLELFTSFVSHQIKRNKICFYRIHQSYLTEHATVGSSDQTEFGEPFECLAATPNFDFDRSPVGLCFRCRWLRHAISISTGARSDYVFGVAGCDTQFRFRPAVQTSSKSAASAQRVRQDRGGHLIAFECIFELTF